MGLGAEMEGGFSGTRKLHPGDALRVILKFVPGGLKFGIRAGPGRRSGRLREAYGRSGNRSQNSHGGPAIQLHEAIMP
jgi:hypothetical protein